MSEGRRRQHEYEQLGTRVRNRIFRPRCIRYFLTQGLYFFPLKLEHAKNEFMNLLNNEKLKTAKIKVNFLVPKIKFFGP